MLQFVHLVLLLEVGTSVFFDGAIVLVTAEVTGADAASWVVELDLLDFVSFDEGVFFLIVEAVDCLLELKDEDKFD